MSFFAGCSVFFVLEASICFARTSFLRAARIDQQTLFCWKQCFFLLEAAVWIATADAARRATKLHICDGDERKATAVKKLHPAGGKASSGMRKKLPP